MKFEGTRLAKFTWALLVYTIFVILFGAFVRATGSGAGCGAHWPLCNGVLVPRPERIETVIEFSHRITSGLTIPLVILLLVWVWRSYPRGSLIRSSSALVMFFIITESLVGAGLVLFELVADNDSIARAFWMMAHLINTFLLLACMVVTAWWATTGVPKRLKLHGLTGALLLLGGLAMLVLGASGAVTALGDTLFPSSSLSQGLVDDFSPTAHWLVRMRIFHPGIAVGVGLYLFLTTVWVRRSVHEPRLEMLTNTLYGFYVAQILLGIINVALLAPVWMQIVHLLVSNLVWITFILMAVVVFAEAVPIRDAQDAASVTDHQVHDRIHEAKEIG
jgi:heme A synthase